MKKRIIAICLVAITTFSMVGCNRTASTQEKSSGNYKIGIITGTVSQNEEEFRAAEKMKEIYKDKIVTATYPDNFASETETLISNISSIASDPDIKAIIIVQAVTGTSAAIDKVRETRPDVLFIAGVPGENPEVISSKADIVFQTNDLAMGNTIIEEAKKMGAETFVHYSFPRHMSISLLAARRDLLKKNAEIAGIKFVEATAPDPTGDSGLSGAQQFILEDVPRKVAEYGQNTAFFSTNCGMQDPLIKKVLDEKAILPQQCCPSPYHGYPGALGIEIPEDKKGDVEYMISQIKSKVEAGGNSGRMATWPIPVNMLMVEAGTKYAIEFAEGKTDGRLDDKVIRKILDDVAGGPGKTFIETYKEVKVGSQDKNPADLTEDDYDDFKNYYMILCDFIEF